MRARPLCHAFFALTSFAACTGQITGNARMSGSGAGGVGVGTGSPSPAPGPGPGGSGGSGSVSPIPFDCGLPQATALHAGLISPSQYDHTVLDLLNVAGDPAKDFGGGTATQLDDLGVERRANAAATIAHQAAVSLAAWSPCQPPVVAAAACEQQLIDRVGAQAFRHPLTAAEHAQMQTLFDAGVKEKDFATGVEWFLTGVLQSPDFLYQLARPAAGEQAGKVRPLGGYELASRLSYFLWDSMPDDKLMAAAAANDLGDPVRLRAELTRMAADARFLRGVTGFYTSWLKLESFREVARDDKSFTSDVVSGLQTSLLLSATRLYDTPAPNVASLFSGQTYYLNDTVRAFYGLGGTGTDFVPVEIGGESRRGILTHPALMALLARPNATNPIARGLFVRRTVMCQGVPPPPVGVTIPPLPAIAPGLSTRDRLEQHTNVALCAACHDQIDPPGFALESFDQVGRRRTMDSGKAVDTSGTMKNGGDLNGVFATGDELLQRIAVSQDVKRCFAQQYFTYALSRDVDTQDQCSIDGVTASFAAKGDLKELAISVAAADSFRFRMSEGVAP
jgi:hypothetical protein